MADGKATETEPTAAPPDAPTGLVPVEGEYSLESARSKMLGDRLHQYHDLLLVTDRRSRLIGWNARAGEPDVNRDFIVIEGELEFTRDFGLKVCKLFDFPVQIRDVKVHEAGGDTHISVIGSVNGQDCTGGCSMGERAPQGWKKSRGGAFHAAQAIAETRMLKRGVELAIGFPILNMYLREAFPTVEFEEGTNRPMRNVTGSGDQKEKAAQGQSARPSRLPPQVQRIRRKLHALAEAEVISEAEAMQQANRVYLNVSKPQVVTQLEKQIDQLFTERGMEVPE